MFSSFVPPLLLGLASSLHCAGMCGPLVLALPLGVREKWLILRQMMVYHTGRILTYAALGLFFGMIGKGFAMAGFQKGLAVTAGVLMLLMAFMAWRFERILLAMPGFGKFTRNVQQGISRLIGRYPGRATFGMGVLNGLLPCGMVYAAIAGAISTSDAGGGALFMVFFGLGTLPLLLGISLLGHSFPAAVRKHLRFVQPVLLTLAGLLLLQRGLHLDLSLFESAVPKAGVDCH